MRCALCGRTRKEVRKLVTSDVTGAAVCDGCIVQGWLALASEPTRLQVSLPAELVAELQRKFEPTGPSENVD